MLKLLEYTDLDTRGVAAQYRKVAAAIAAGDFHAAQVRKLAGPAGRGMFYRARLNDADRLLFTLVRCGETTGALMLEVIRQHDYAGSRFLRGAAIDEAKIDEAKSVAVELDQALSHAEPLRYLHPERGSIHLLDKPLSFDDAQQAVFELPPPAIVVGSAGSGKTALTLEKLKQAQGDVLYVTHSPYLAQGARDLYYAHGFERDGQDAAFLAYREFLESIRVPDGQEATWPRFAAWFDRQRQAFRGIDAHQAFEEIRGVITAQADGLLSREAYVDLGVRQSIFSDAEREAVHALYERYRAWLAEAGLYDLNLLAHERMPLALPRYDFVVIDEVQDLTPVQLALVLKTLRHPGQFLLCGDSNQIVHPNFFSWSQVKTLFWHDAELAGRQQLRVLGANFRNASETTRIANTLLKVKHRRFGSIDRESNFLVDAVGAEAGNAVLLSDKDAVLRDLDRQSRQSTEVAVLVMREEDKAAARRHFRTPLLFSVHEAKGLEYPNIVLYRFVSDHRGEFAAIADGVDAADLVDDRLDYRRARDKADKSAEVYKFFVNALYVALTRAVRNVYLVESDTTHPLLALLRIGQSDAASVQARAASREDWQREAHRLELQGKQEQAEAIRRDVLRQAVPPWPVFDQGRLRQTLVRVFREQAVGTKPRQQLLDYAALYDAPDLAEMLAVEARFGSREGFERQQAGLVAKQLASFSARNFKDVLRQCDQFGVDHRTTFNMTPLMAAAAAGNLPLVDALLERGADTDRTDDFGCTALHWSLRAAFARPEYARESVGPLYERLAPAAVDLQAAQRLVRIDRHLSEYLLVQTLWTLLRTRFTRPAVRAHSGFDSAAVLAAWEHLPASVLRPHRNKRSHVSALLSRNEIARDYAWNRGLFRRHAHGRYQFNPELQVRVKRQGDTVWVPLFEHLNLGLINELTVSHTPALHGLAEAAGIGPLPVPIASERLHARIEAEHEARRQRIAALEQERLRLQREHERRLAARGWAIPEPAPTHPDAPDPPWGTPEARKLALQRLAARTTTRRKRSKA